MHDSTRYAEMPQFLRLSMRAPYRLQALRNLAPSDWRKARACGFGNWHSYSGALAFWAGGWHCHTEAQFRDERWADECDGGPSHTGWHTQEDGTTYKDGTGIARGIVSRLPHGRFVAGYWWGDNRERVYLPEVYSGEREAARAADGHAETFAETQRDDNARFNRMTDAQGELENAETQLADWRALRRAGRRDTVDVLGCIKQLRDAREALEVATREYEGA